MIGTDYEDKVIEEIIEMIKTNLVIRYNSDDSKLIGLRKYCKDKKDKKYKSLPYYQLLYFVEETLADLINSDFLYDFRPLE